MVIYNFFLTLRYVTNYDDPVNPP